MSLDAIHPALIGAIDDWLIKQGKVPQLGAGQSPPVAQPNTATPRLGASMPPQGATPPIVAGPAYDTPQPSMPAKIGAGQPDWLATHPQPTAPDPTQYHPSFMRKLGGVGLGILAGAHDPAEGIKIGSAFINEPETKLQEKYNTEEQQWKTEAELQQKPELAELKGAMAERLRAQQDADTAKRLADTLADRDKNTAATNTNRLDIAKLEAHNRAAIAAGKPQPTKTIMVSGKPHIMERDPASGEYSIDRGEAPENYAQIAPSLKTIDVIDPNTGLPTVETLSGKPLGVSATGAYGHEMAQAGAVERAGEELKTAIQANRNNLGNVGAIINSAFLNTPLDNPVAKGLAVKLASYAALNPAMHGARGQQAIKMFEQIVGSIPDNPDALIAAIDAIGGTAHNINPSVNQPGGGTATSGGFAKWKATQK